MIEKRLNSLFGNEWDLSTEKNLYWDSDLTDLEITNNNEEDSSLTIEEPSITPFWGIYKDPSDIDYKSDEYKVNHKYGLHGRIIENASSAASNPIPETYKNLVFEMCRKCDIEYGVNSNEFCTTLHGNGNYYASLDFLWTYCKNIEKTKIIQIIQFQKNYSEYRRSNS